MSVRYRFDEDRCIPAPPWLVDAAEAQQWADEATRIYADRVSLDEDATKRVRNLLDDVVRSAADGRGAALLFLPEPGIAAMLNIFYSPQAATEDQLSGFLSPPGALVRPRRHRVDTEALGAGVTTATVAKRDGREYAMRRWFFPGQEGTVLVSVGPVNVYGLAFVDEVANDIVASLSIEGFVPDPAGHSVQALTDPDVLEEQWQL